MNSKQKVAILAIQTGAGALVRYLKEHPEVLETVKEHAVAAGKQASDTADKVTTSAKSHISEMNEKIADRIEDVEEKVAETPANGERDVEMLKVGLILGAILGVVGGALILKRHI